MVDTKDRHTFWEEGDRLLGCAGPSAVTKPLGNHRGVEAAGGHMPVLPRVQVTSSLGWPNQPGLQIQHLPPWVPFFHKHNFTKRQFIADELNNEPISQITYMLTVATQIFVEILIIQEKVCCLTFKTNLNWTSVYHCQRQEEDVYDAITIYILRLATHLRGMRPPGRMEATQAILNFEDGKAAPLRVSNTEAPPMQYIC